MAYDPTTGEWKDEETSVEKRMGGLLSSSSPYMKQAETAGKQAANRRGLLNSTMAVTAIEDSRIRSALPIAQQDASQANQREMQGRDIQAGEMTQKRGLTSNEALTREGYGLQRELQGGDIASRERMQERDIASTEATQGREIVSREKIATMDQDTQRWLAQFDANTRERLQTLDNDTRVLMQELDIDSQQRIANMNIATENRTQAARLAASFELGYQSLIESLMNNPDIPAEARQTFMNHANRMRENNLRLVEQMYDIDLEWEEEEAA